MFNGELYGDVISYIAGMTGDFATINQDDELEFIFNTSTSEVIEDYVELDDKRDTRPITIVVLGNKNITGQEAVRIWAEGVALYGENYLRINDNLFAYTLEKREALIDAIYNKVKGFGYSSFESKYSFKPYMQLGDLVQFKNKNGDLVNSIILRIETDYDNIILSAPSIIDASVDYELTQTAYDIAKRAEIIVNQATGDITLLAEQTNTLSLDLTETNNAVATTQIDLLNTTEIANNATDNSLLALEGVETLEDTTSTLGTAQADLTTRLEYQETTVSDLVLDIDGVKQSMTYSGGYNLIENCVKQFGEAGWTGTFVNYSDTEIQQNSLTKSALVFMEDTETREIQVENREERENIGS